MEKPLAVKMERINIERITDVKGFILPPNIFKKINIEGEMNVK
jgi:hypothetical protein